MTLITHSTAEGTLSLAYTYDSFNRLSSSSADNSLNLYAYDASDSRIYRSTVNADGTEITCSYLYSAYGDVTELTDNADGSLAAAYEYDAFGEILRSTVSEGIDNSVTYRGYEYDSETGLYYLNARYYDPETARFLTEDTYRGTRDDPLSLNRYVYCQSNPIRYVDPSGHSVGENYKNGKARERELLKKYPGIPNKYFETTIGPGGRCAGRFIDVYYQGIAYESKVGYTCKTKFVVNEAMKDYSLMQKDMIKQSVWVFSSSPVTGRCGASGKLLALLDDLGIIYKFE